MPKNLQLVNPTRFPTPKCRISIAQVAVSRPTALSCPVGIAIIHQLRAASLLMILSCLPVSTAWTKVRKRYLNHKKKNQKKNPVLTTPILDPMPGTHHHSLQHKQVSNLASEADSPEANSPYSRTPALRNSHKIAERKRRTEMKQLFDALRAQIPASHGSKSSKWEILSKGMLS